ALAQMGKMITGEPMTPKSRHENTVTLEEYRADQDKDKPGVSREAAGLLNKADGRNKTVAASTTAPPPSMDAVTSTVPRPQTEALRAPAKTKTTEFKDEK